MNRGPFGGAHFWKVVSKALSTTTKGLGEGVWYHMHALYQEKFSWMCIMWSSANPKHNHN